MRLAATSIADIMRLRLDKVEDIGYRWVYQTYSSKDGIAYNGKGKVKIVVDSPISENLNSINVANVSTKEKVLSLNEYNSIEGEEFTYKNISQYVNTRSNNRKILDNPIWQILTRNQELLKDYLRYALAIDQKCSSIYPMNIITSYFGIPYPRFHLWNLSSSENRSHLESNGVFNANNSRLIGKINQP